MSTVVAFSPGKYYEDAQKMLEKKDLLGFVSKIGIAVEASMNDPEMKARATYLESKGLMEFYQHTKAIESIDEALKYNTGAEAFELRKLQATARGFLGKFNQALNTYKVLLDEANDNIAVVRICINLSWAYLMLNRENPEELNFEEIKKYLDQANQYFNEIPDFLKVKLLNNLSVFHFYKGDFDKSISVLKEAVNYAEEKDIPRLYNNLAEVYLEYREQCGIEITSISDYLDKSETIASKYDDKLAMAVSFFIKGKLELMDDQMFTALDTLFLAFTHFTEEEAYSYSLEVLLKINEVVSNHKAECMRIMQKKLNNKARSNPYYEKIFKK